MGCGHSASAQTPLQTRSLSRKKTDTKQLELLVKSTYCMPARFVFTRASARELWVAKPGLAVQSLQTRSELWTPTFRSSATACTT